MPADVSAQLCGLEQWLIYLHRASEATGVIDDQAVRPGRSAAALCFRSLVTGVPYARQNPVEARWDRCAGRGAGIAEVRASGDLQGKPAIILHGRSDPFCRPTTPHAPTSAQQDRSRGSAAGSLHRGRQRQSFRQPHPAVRRLEPDFRPNTLVPMHYYFEQAFGLMRDHLLGKGGTAIPPSQVLVGSVANKPWDTLAKARLDMPDLVSQPASRQEHHVQQQDLEHSLKLAVLGCGSARSARAIGGQ